MERDQRSHAWRGLVDRVVEVDLQIAFEMERQITDGREALACGCLIKVICTFPNAPWVYTMWPTILCSEHDGIPWRPPWWVNTPSGYRVDDLVIKNAVRDSIRVHLPFIVMDTWPGLLKERQALISREGEHVIRHDGRVFERP